MFSLLHLILNQLTLTLFISLRALRRNKLRSGLTALGIIIGVAAVVAMVALHMIYDGWREVGPHLM